MNPKFNIYTIIAIIAATAVVVLAFTFWNPLKDLFAGKPAVVVPVELTPEYKDAQKVIERMKRDSAITAFKDSILTAENYRLYELLDKKQIIYKNEKVRIQNNTADNNFSELRAIIGSRKKVVSR